MTSPSNKLVNRLESEKKKTLDLFSQLSDQNWQLTLYTEGEHWSVRQVFQHMVTAENSILRLMRSIRTGSKGVPEDFDLDAYNERKVKEMGDLSLPDLLSLFAENRDLTIEWVSQLSAEDLAKEGRHPFLGVAPIESMIKLLYRHTQLHQRDIRRLLQGA